ncbi:50S ribosomal protein L11 methyltransferase [Aurantiacibacter spongiae]|uniref:Ribosomal protein L11 methyltransferase n=1 Tax=Aurantiacibacter spongiae TaxID=2488860 RepID=A0A3N5CT63_9SPHN|nr:50S ribosomal protein L11 methyltransferase [Aurantiacibacter spongiae]RPF70560.1 50S ribosomal protein L11 methyltransferase [Aurantiacibacter spongiae]
MSWKLSAVATREVVEGALARQDEMQGWDDTTVLAGFEVDPDEPDCWRLDAYTATKPTEADREAVRALFSADPPPLIAEALPESDWVSESQRGVDPITAGRFRVRTPEHRPADDPAFVEFCIPAAQAFGTGQHATTAGCLAMLDVMARQGVSPRTVADIGTGTGLLAFAAMALWPHGRFTASDIDPVCDQAVVANAALNGIDLGDKRGELTMLVADGLADERLARRAPFDLLIANILAGPLIDLAPDFAEAVNPRGSIVLAGLLRTQDAAVRSAYRRVGFRLQKRILRGDWSVLWLRHRFVGQVR